MLDCIADLTKRIETKWDSMNNCVHKFPELVREEMDADRIVRQFDFKRIGNWLSLNSLRSIQISSEFSDLHLKLFDNGRFYVEVLNWMERDTAIHDHGFSGVLVQLQGSALNSVYAFSENPSHSTGQTLRFGNVSLKKAFVSKAGDVHTIPAGRAEIHSVHHLEHPTCSLIIRTHPVAEVSPQLNYFPPFLCANHSATDLVFNKRIKYLKLLNSVSKNDFRSEFMTTIESCSYSDLFWYGLKLSSLIFSPHHVHLLRDMLATRPAAERELVERVLKSIGARHSAVTLTEKIKSNESDVMIRLHLSMMAAASTKGDLDLMQACLGVKLDERQLLSVAEKSNGPVKSALQRTLKHFEIHGASA